LYIFNPKKLLSIVIIIVI